MFTLTVYFYEKSCNKKNSIRKITGENSVPWPKANNVIIFVSKIVFQPIERMQIKLSKDNTTGFFFKCLMPRLVS